MILSGAFSVVASPWREQLRRGRQLIKRNNGDEKLGHCPKGVRPDRLQPARPFQYLRRIEILGIIFDAFFGFEERKKELSKRRARAMGWWPA